MDKTAGWLADRLSAAEAAVDEKRVAAEQLALSGADDDQLDRAEADARAATDRVETLRAAAPRLEEQIVQNESELAECLGGERQLGGRVCAHKYINATDFHVYRLKIFVAQIPAKAFLKIDRQITCHRQRPLPFLLPPRASRPGDQGLNVNEH